VAQIYRQKVFNKKLKQDESVVRSYPVVPIGSEFRVDFEKGRIIVVEPLGPPADSTELQEFSRKPVLGRPSALSQNLRIFLEENPQYIAKLKSKHRRQSLREISHLVCGTTQYQRADKNLVQTLGRWFPNRKRSSRPTRVTNKT